MVGLCRIFPAFWEEKLIVPGDEEKMEIESERYEAKEKKSEGESNNSGNEEKEERRRQRKEKGKENYREDRKRDEGNITGK